MNKVYMIGNTHFDPIWLWKWDEALASIRATFRSALDRMNENPDFKYSFSCPPVFEWIKNVDPELFRDIGRRVRDGRWRVDEGMWLQADLYSACGESYVRQCLYGQRYLMENFGVYSDTAFSADSFGHSSMLPQILAKSRIPYCVIGRPDGVDLPLDDPLFRWASPDGSSVLTYRLNDVFSGWSRDAAAQMDIALDRSDKLGHSMALVYGVTDHGGAPTKRDISSICDYSSKYPGRIEFSGTTEFFADAGNSDGLRCIDGELKIRYFGVFNNCPDVKTANRRAEYLLFDAEKASVAACEISKRAYPYEKLKSACRDMLFCQFHDILGGASIPEAYREVSDIVGSASFAAGSELTFALQSVAKDIELPPSDEIPWNLVVFNQNPYPYSGEIEAEVQWVWEFGFYEGGVTLLDENGETYPAQLITARSVIPGFRSRFVFKAEIPASGYRAFRVKRGENQAKAAGLLRVELEGEAGTIENDRYLARFDGTGIISLSDKRSGRVVKPCGQPFAVGDDSDVWAFNFTGWGPEGSFEPKSVKIVENGEVRAKIRCESSFGNSTFCQDITICRGDAPIKCGYRVDWNEKHTDLKLRFGKRRDDNLTASVPYGWIKRECDGVERPVGEWLGISGEGNGFSLALDGMFGYCADGERVCPTVLRSPIIGDLRLAPLDYEKFDYRYLGQGVSTGGWMLAFDGGEDISRGFSLGMELNNPPVVCVESNHRGSLPMSGQFALVDDPDSIVLSALKYSEDGVGDIILRLVNITCDPRKTSVALFGNVRSPALSFGPFEIKTLRIDKNRRFTETNLLEQ